jgi:epoxyqueuosine reductase
VTDDTPRRQERGDEATAARVPDRIPDSTAGSLPGGADPGELAARLKSWALAEGFDRAGVAALEPAAHGEAFLRWLSRGDLAGMAYLERRLEVRLEPAAALPGARSALCVALQYHPLAGEPEPAGDLWPRVARYARGRDYHDVMGDGLRRLAARIGAAFPGVASRP